MNFYPDLILLDDELYTEAAEWCNNNGAHIEEVEPKEDGTRQFKSVQNEVHVPTEEEIIQSLTNVIQAALDAFAQQKNYDGIMSACSYANSTDSKFKAEAEYCIKLRDTTWNKAYEILDDVKLGIKEQPTIENIVSMLPIGSASWDDVTY